MRCNNCGYDNAPGSATCVKCGHPLQSENVGNDSNAYNNVRVPNNNYRNGVQPRPTVINTPHAEFTPKPTVMGASRQEPMPRPTRIGNSPLQPDASPLQPTMAGQNEAQPPQRCTQCGYPVMGNFTSCPNCGASLAQDPETPADASQKPAETKKHAYNESARPSISEGLDIEKEVKCDKCGAMVPIEYRHCPACGERIHLKTMKVVRHKPAPAPHCHLTLIPEEDEEVAAVKQDYEGTSIILNRDNTEPANRTITSREQAELTFEDGKWFITDKSELQSTYLGVNRKMEIQPGDIVMMGDRRFKFEADNGEK